MAFTYRSTLTLEGDGFRISGGQGDWIVIAGTGPDAAPATSVRRDRLEDLAQALTAMRAYLTVSA